MTHHTFGGDDERREQRPEGHEAQDAAGPDAAGQTPGAQAPGAQTPGAHGAATPESAARDSTAGDSAARDSSAEGGMPSLPPLAAQRGDAGARPGADPGREAPRSTGSASGWNGPGNSGQGSASRPAGPGGASGSGAPGQQPFGVPPRSAAPRHGGAAQGPSAPGGSVPGGSAPDGSAPGRTPSGHDGAYGRPRPSTPHGAPQHGAPQHGSPQHSQFGSATAAFGAPGRTPGHTPGPGSASAHPTSPATKQDARTGRGARATVVLLSLLLPIGIAAGLVAGYLYADRFQSYDTAAVEREVVSVLRDDYGLSDLQEVNCPDWVKVEQGTSFQCEFEYAGATQTVTVTQGSQSGQLVVGAPDGQ